MKVKMSSYQTKVVIIF